MASGAVVMDKTLGGGGGGGEGGRDVWGRGKKRVADESNLTDLERFEKRLRLLSIREQRNDRRNHQQLYTPVSSHDAPSSTATSRRRRSSRRARDTNGSDDQMMQIDDRPDRIYIHDLDAELASDSDSTSDSSEKLIFLPDIEERFSRLPAQVLNPSSGEGSQEMVLYSVPKSLSVDEGQDSVRKAVIEARARARERALEESRERQGQMERLYDQSNATEDVESAHGFSSGYGNGNGDDHGKELGQVQQEGGKEWEGDVDAMDID